MIIALCAGCGGGSGGGSTVTPTTGGTGGTGGGNVVAPTPAPVATGTTAPSGSAKVPLTITIPKSTGSSSSTRSRAYIDPGAGSIVLTLLSTTGTGATPGPQTFNVTAASPNCVAGQSGLVCTFTIDAPVGSDLFLATTYRTVNGTGTALGSGAIALAVAANTTNSANLVLTGPVSSVQVFATSSYLGTQPSSTGRAPNARAVSRSTQSTISSTRVFLIALDAAGNQIINPTLYDIPITLTLHDGGLPANGVVLSVAYAGLPGEPTTPASTATDGGSVIAYAPSDSVSLSLGSAPGSGYPSITASYTPQAGPNANVLQSFDTSFYVTTPPPIVATAALSATASVTGVTPGTPQYYTYTVQAYDANNNPLSSSQRLEDAQGNYGYGILNLNAGSASFYPYFYYGVSTVSSYYDGTGITPITVTPAFGSISGAPVTVAINPALVWSSPDSRFAFRPGSSPGTATLQFLTNADGAATLTLTAIAHSYGGSVVLTTSAGACTTGLSPSPAFGVPSAPSSPFTVTIQPYSSPAGMTCQVTATENAPPNLSTILTVYVNNVGVQAQGKGVH